jgi:hypothetical protein
LFVDVNDVDDVVDDCENERQKQRDTTHVTRDSSDEKQHARQNEEKKKRIFVIWG